MMMAVVTKQSVFDAISSKKTIKIGFADIDKVCPTRADFIDKRLFEYECKCRDARIPILFHPVSVFRGSPFVPTKMCVCGVGISGARICVVINDYKPYFDIEVPEHITAGGRLSEFTINVLDLIEATDDTAYQRNKMRVSIRAIKQYPLRRFSPVPIDFIRVWCRTIGDREKMLKNCEAKNISTAFDDRLYVAEEAFAFMARDYGYKTAGWNLVQNYEVTTSGYRNVDFVLEITPTNLVRVKKNGSVSNKISTAMGIALRSEMKQRILVECWDTEVDNEEYDGRISTPNGKFNFPTICMTYSWMQSPDILASYCVSYPMTPPIKDGKEQNCGIVVECANEEEVVRARLQIMKRMNPDVTCGFNSDNYDWGHYNAKLNKYHLQEAFINDLSVQTDYKPEKYTPLFARLEIKVEAGLNEKFEYCLRIPGLLNFDVRAEMMRKGGTKLVGTGLNHYLAEHKLELKEDMKIEVLLRIFRRCRALVGAQCTCAEKKVWGAQPDEVIDVDYAYDGKTRTENKDLVRARDAGKCVVCARREASRVQMGEIGYYCIIDATQPIKLCHKTGIFGDNCQLATMTYTALLNSFMKANAAKVRNSIARNCIKSGVGYIGKMGNKQQQIEDTIANDVDDDESSSSDDEVVEQVAKSANVGKDSKKDEPRDLFPGAYVFKPTRGRFARKPISALDFSSLYPSLILTYNLSPDMLITNEKKADELKRLGYTLHEIGPATINHGVKNKPATWKPVQLHGWTIRHNNVEVGNTRIRKFVRKKGIEIKKDGKWQFLGFGDELTAEQKMRMVGNEIREVDDYYPVEGRNVLPHEQQGICPATVFKLVEKRRPLKALMNALKKTAEDAEKAHKQVVAFEGADYTIDDLKYKLKQITARQNALKVLSNTLYGTIGQPSASIYNTIIAFAVTNAGQTNIKMVAKYLIDNGYTIHYGDTDSVYTSAPDRLYAEEFARNDKAMEAYRSRYPDGNQKELHKIHIEYGTNVVWIAKHDMDRLTKEVFHLLIETNGTKYLAMAYEEVGFPTVMCGKKKYFLRPHIEQPMFDENAEPMVRGIKTRTRNVPPAISDMCMQFMKRMLSIDCTETLNECAQNTLYAFLNRKWNPKDLAMIDTYKKNTKNVKVNTFVRRMQERLPLLTSIQDRELNAPPEVGDKIRYVIVASQGGLTFDGKLAKSSVGDKMEYLRLAQALEGTPKELPLDLRYYITKNLFSALARFTCGGAEFQPPDGEYDLEDDAQYKKFDAKCVDNARKWLKRLLDAKMPEHLDSLKLEGRLVRKNFNQSLKQLKVGGDAIALALKADANNLNPTTLDALFAKAKPECMHLDLEGMIAIESRKMRGKTKKDIRSKAIQSLVVRYKQRGHYVQGMMRILTEKIRASEIEIATLIPDAIKIIASGQKDIGALTQHSEMCKPIKDLYSVWHRKQLYLSLRADYCEVGNTLEQLNREVKGLDVEASPLKMK